MLTLIMREIEDNWVFFVITVIFAVVISGMFFWLLYYGTNEDVFFIGLPVFNAIFGMLVFCGFGAAQMYADRTKKVSSLLATLAIRRIHIYIARVIAGILLVLIGLAPLAGITFTAVFTRTAEPSHSIRLLYPEISIPVFLLGFACYCIGLQAGWTTNRLMPSLGAISLSIVLVSVILIKGFGWEIYAILVLFIAACLIRAWRIFLSAPL